VKALALLSGGLDSLLAAKLILVQGIEVIGVGFSSPFFSTKKSKKAALQLGIPLIEVDITEEVIQLLKGPKHGFGRHMNPCVDCHTLMVRKAGEMMKKQGASFLITGEVLGERPKSQNRQALEVVSRESGFDGYVLRPLSAKLLSLTIPEKKGWVEREKLLDIQGRSRRRQMALAKEMSIKDYPTPAGGCLLTDPAFSSRLRQLKEFNSSFQASDANLLKLGRHFWFNKAWVVVSRNESENGEIEKFWEEGDYLVLVKNFPGPIGLVRGEPSDKELREALALVARYSKGRDAPRLTGVVKQKSGEEKTFEVKQEDWLKYVR
jgi:tRNA U34 2-thiouridine synthase MnmA/TrmU